MWVASCINFVSRELRVALIVGVASCPYNASCELRVERKLRVGNSKLRVETKIASCLFSFEKGLFRQIKRYSEVAIQFATFFVGFLLQKAS